MQDVDIGDDRPIPSHRDGADAYDVFLDKLRHPRAAEVVKSLQQFVAAFKDRAKGPQRTPTRQARLFRVGERALGTRHEMLNLEFKFLFSIIHFSCVMEPMFSRDTQRGRPFGEVSPLHRDLVVLLLLKGCAAFVSCLECT